MCSNKQHQSINSVSNTASVSYSASVLHTLLPSLLLPLAAADVALADSFPQPEGLPSKIVASALDISSAQTPTSLFVNSVSQVETIADGQAFRMASNPSPVATVTTAETEGSRSFQILSVLALLGLGTAAVAASWMQSRRMAEPLKELSIVAERLAAGNLDQIALSTANTAEVETVVQSLNQLMRQVQRLQQEQDLTTRYAQLVAEITRARILGEADVKRVFNQALADARQMLNVDRIVVYRFKPDWGGYIANEAVGAGLPRALNDSIEDACIPEDLLEAYKTDRVVATVDVMNAGFHPKHKALMEQLHIKANLVTPILNEGQLFGLLVAHDCTQIRHWQQTEVNTLKQLALQFGAILDRLTLLDAREKEANRSQILKEIMLELSQADTPELVLAKLPVAKVRTALAADRVIIYQFDEEWKGTIIAESVAAGYPKALGAVIFDPCFAQDYVTKYQTGQVQATPNIAAAGLTECHLRQLEPFEVQANLVAPILQSGQLLGLLIAHQCSGPRQWEPQDIAFMTQASTQVGLALDRAHLMEQRKLAVAQAEILAEEQRLQRERLQNQLILLLDDIEGAARGDLTVRAEVTNSEIGTVADFFNSIVESLRQIVVQVKGSALNVSSSIGNNREAIQQFSNTALVQAEEITLILQSIQQMIASIESVADSAQAASTVAGQAAETSEAGKAAIDRAVQNILSLRDVIGETAKKVKRLGESSQEISKVVSLIEQIALQTNLLSINAGIEAARAGEEGQGFAAVAEEIGKLAAQSATATREIEEMVRSIQLETNEVAAAMERNTLKVVEGSNLVEDAKQSLGKISTVSQQIDQFVRSIREAAVSQTQTSQQITAQIQAIAQVTEHNAEASQTVAASLQQAIDLAHELETSVGRFHIGEFL